MDPREFTEIVDRIKAARVMRGLGSRELAKRAGLSSAAVSRLETRKVEGLEVATLVQIADALGVRREWLLTGEGSPDPSKRRDSGARVSQKTQETQVVSEASKESDSLG